MSKIVHPYSHRLVILRDWKSRWFALGNKFVDLLKGDVLLREYLEKKLRGSYVADIQFERGPKTTKIIIQTSRPGMLIGRSGEGVQNLKKSIASFMKKRNLPLSEDFQIDIVDIPAPEGNAMIVAQMVADGLEKRMPFRRIMKQTAEKVMATRGVKGVKIVMSGRLGGAEMARREETKQGGIPLQTMRADIDYARYTARLSYGGIGIKVWIYKGDSLEQKNSKNK